MVMMDTAELDSAGKKRTERINSIIALVIVIDKIPNVIDKESFLPVLEKLLKSLSNYDQAEVVKGLDNRILAIALVMELVRKPEPVLKPTNNGFLLFITSLVIVVILSIYKMFNSWIRRSLGSFYFLFYQMIY